MANTKISDRQYPLVALANLTKANIGAANTVTFAIPVGALVLDVGLFTVTAFDSATTTTGTIGDGTTTFAAAVDLKTVGAETVANAPKFYPTGGTMTVTLAETGATATVGQALAYFRYVILNRGNEMAY